MLCDNCGKREANVRYSENINGKKREMYLCEECSKKLGVINKMDLNLNTSFSNLFGSILEDFGELETMPMFNEIKQSVCNYCNTSFDDIVNTGRLGCPHCYDIFSDRLDPILKRLQGSNRHVGRISENVNNFGNIEHKQDEKSSKTAENISKIGNTSKNINDKNLDIQKNQIMNLEEQLKLAIKEERYEDAAKIRDEIKEQNKKNK